MEETTNIYMIHMEQLQTCQLFRPLTLFARLGGRSSTFALQANELEKLFNGFHCIVWNGGIKELGW
jgi:hypothetical protein